jgi:nicotinamide riboside transporter PnuC
MAYVGTVLTILGILLNSKQRIESWAVWIVGDAIWIVTYWPRHDWAVVITNSVFVVVNFYGWWAWTRAKKNSTSATSR